MKTNSTSWESLNAQIDQYTAKAKVNLLKFQKQRFHYLYKKKNVPKTQQSSDQSKGMRIGLSMNLLREKFHEEEERSRIIDNRLHFLNVQRDRAMHSSQIAKRKMQRVSSIRSIKLQDKQLVKNEIEMFKSQVKNKNHQLALRAKSQRSRISEARSKVLSENSFKAHQAKLQRVLNQEAISTEKIKIVERKKQMRIIAQQRGKAEIQKNRKMQRQLLQVGKINHFKEVQQQFLKYDHLRKDNLDKFCHFVNVSKNLVEEAKAASSQLQSYEKFLLTNRRKQRISVILNSTKKSKQTNTTHSTPSSPIKNNIFFITN